MTGPLKWHGGKSYLADKIISLMPPRCKYPNKPAPHDDGWLHYVEPYFGGGAVLLANDPEGISEVVNDLNEDLTIFWRVLSSDGHFPEFLRRAQATPFSEKDWNKEPESEVSHGSFARLQSATETALRFFVKCRQSLSGRMKGFAGITRNRTRRGMNEQVSAWLNAIEGLPAVHSRLMRVLIRNKPALEIIRAEDGPRTLFYLDPPYLHETRATTDEYGENEMTPEQHHDLLTLLRTIKGRFLLSGYRSGMYDTVARTSDWKRRDFSIDNKASGGKTKRKMVECVWTNF